MGVGKGKQQRVRVPANAGTDRLYRKEDITFNSLARNNKLGIGLVSQALRIRSQALQLNLHDTATVALTGFGFDDGQSVFPSHTVSGAATVSGASACDCGQTSFSARICSHHAATILPMVLVSRIRGMALLKQYQVLPSLANANELRQYFMESVERQGADEMNAILERLHGTKGPKDNDLTISKFLGDVKTTKGRCALCPYEEEYAELGEQLVGEETKLKNLLVRPQRWLVHEDVNGSQLFAIEFPGDQETTYATYNADEGSLRVNSFNFTESIQHPGGHDKQKYLAWLVPFLARVNHEARTIRVHVDPLLHLNSFRSAVAKASQKQTGIDFLPFMEQVKASTDDRALTGPTIRKIIWGAEDDHLASWRPVSGSHGTVSEFLPVFEKVTF